MQPCSERIFNEQLKRMRDQPESGLTGPFVHSAPAGNPFSGPFKEYAWMIGKAVVLKRVWTPDTEWLYYRDEGTED